MHNTHQSKVKEWNYEYMNDIVVGVVGLLVWKPISIQASHGNPRIVLLS
jgi:hypothetical protein